MIDDFTFQRSAGLNRGIKEATGEIILRIDARTIIPNNYIEQCVNTLIKTGADNVGGVQKPIVDNTTNLVQAAIGYAMSHPFGVGNAQFRLGKKSGCVDSVYLGCFRREVFTKVGLFDEESPIITEDSDINYRIRLAGGKVYLNKDIIAYYLPREKISALAKLYYRYGGARAGFLLKWKTYTGYRQLIPPLFLLFLISLPILSIFVPPLLLVWAFMCGTYIMADMLATLAVVRQSKQWRQIPYLMCIFPAMHFSWAFGFWVRLLQRKKHQYWQG